MLEELFDNEPIDNAVFNRILHIYKAENKEGLYFLIGNNEVALPETREGFRKMSPLLPKSRITCLCGM